MKILPIMLFAVGVLLPCPGADAPRQGPLPTLEEIFPRIVERAKRETENDRKFDSTYVYVRSKVTEYRNGDGELKKHDAKISTNNPALKRASAKPPAARPPTKPTAVSATHSNVRGRQFEQDDFAVSSNLVKRFEFKLIRREQLHQRPMLVIDFEPKKGRLPERNLKDKFINRAAGRVWLDEQDYAIVKADLRLTERVNVLGGLVGAIWKFTYGFERERVADGLWFTRDEKWHLEGREVIFERIVDFHAERTAVRKAEQATGAASAPAGEQ